MEMMGKIQRMYVRDKLSLHQIAKRTGPFRNTIRKWIRALETKQPEYQRQAALNPDFCNVASVWEKGIVEKNVQDSRRRIWLDAQGRLFHTFDELNVWPGQRCRTVWSELPHPQYEGLTVADVLELERLKMMPMPSALDGYIERTVRVSSTCLISVARNR